MKPINKILILLLFCLVSLNGKTQNRFPDGKIAYEQLVLTNGDTVYLTHLRPLYCYPPLKFKNKAQEKFYWKTVRDVKKTLPYARIVGRTLNEANTNLSKMKTEGEQKKYLKKLEQEVKVKYEGDLRKMTFSQGKMLIRLIDRETSYTSYELIKMYRGTFSAMLWQGVARIFGSDLKAEYDGADKDKIVERVITLVEAGQL